MNMIKHSLRSPMIYYVVALSAIIFCCIGFSIGNRLGKDIDNEN